MSLTPLYLPLSLGIYVVERNWEELYPQPYPRYLLGYLATWPPQLLLTLIRRGQTTAPHLVRVRYHLPRAPDSRRAFDLVV